MPGRNNVEADQACLRFYCSTQDKRKFRTKKRKEKTKQDEKDLERQSVSSSGHAKLSATAHREGCVIGPVEFL
ncbi:hypothetical protein PoB_007041500 [Plakobranchus ocellatus]|uniref:Uncharacterized protein n=1 Tax=Plakobranchus ocellatus TaxID=259542 RepID=A0AAV4DIU9_9GAST|nr:hypothetical protein PoB_007041500 [Plakobranchus ocellatus]